MALRALDAETQKYVAESLPMARVVSIARAHGSTTDSTNPLLYTGNTGERLQEEEVELFPPALLGQLSSFEHIALWSGGRVSNGRLPILGAPGGAVGSVPDDLPSGPAVRDAAVGQGDLGDQGDQGDTGSGADIAATAEPTP